MVGLGHEFSLGRTLRVSANGPQHDQGNVVAARLLGKAARKVFRTGIVQFEVQHDQIRPVSPRQFQPRTGPAGRKSPQTTAFQRGLQHFPGFFRVIDNQHASLAVQDNDLHVARRLDFPVHPKGGPPAVLIKPRPLVAPHNLRSRPTISGRAGQKRPEDSESCPACQSELCLDSGQTSENNDQKPAAETCANPPVCGTPAPNPFSLLQRHAS